MEDKRHCQSSYEFLGTRPSRVGTDGSLGSRLHTLLLYFEHYF